MKKEEVFHKDKIGQDFSNGKELLKNIGPSVTIFGSART